MYIFKVRAFSFLMSESQKKVWNKIATPWKQYRVQPELHAKNFLRGKRGKILDLACGTGRNITSCKRKQFYGVDFSEKMIEYAKQYAKEKKIKANFIVAESSNLPFQDNLFDNAIYIKGLHCVEGKEEREKTIKELYRVLKPKAKVIISVWSKNQERVKNKGKECFMPWEVEGKKVQRYTYLFDKKELEDLLKQAGFKILESKEDENIIIIVEK